ATHRWRIESACCPEWATGSRHRHCRRRPRPVRQSPGVLTRMTRNCGRQLRNRQGRFGCEAGDPKPRAQVVTASRARRVRMFELLVVVLVMTTALFDKRIAAARKRHADRTAPEHTSLFDKPDTSSTVLRILPDDAIVDFLGTEGRFLHVTTRDNVVGYVFASACRPASDADVGDGT